MNRARKIDPLIIFALLVGLLVIVVTGYMKSREAPLAQDSQILAKTDQIIVSPASGTIPLDTTLTVTLNTDSSCDQKNYTLVFGDFNENTRQEPGNQAGQVIIFVPQGTCAPKTVTFTYRYSDCGSEIGKPIGICEPMVYEDLGKGQTKRVASAQVQLVGINAIGSQPTRVIRLSYAPTFGVAPFTVAIYASMTNGSASIDFGDGTSEPNWTTHAGGGDEALYIQHTYMNPGSYTITVMSDNQKATTKITVDPAPN